MRTLKPREVKCPPQGHRAGKGKAGLDLRLSDLNFMLLHHFGQLGPVPVLGIYSRQGDSGLKHAV